MALSSADRQRRYRRHLKGDHSLCDPQRECRTAPPAAAPEPEPAAAAPRPPTPPADRGPRGARLWADMGGDTLAGPGRVLLDEACRITDRLDRLDAILGGRDEWLRGVRTDDGGEVRVVVDAVLAESRQQATALRGLIAELGKAATKPSERGKPVPTGPTPKGIANLAAEAAKRRGVAR